MKNKKTYFLDKVIDERDFKEQFCKMVSSCIDLDMKNNQ